VERDQPKARTLRVKPAFATPVVGSGQAFCIEVVNLSGFAVTVIDVGFTMTWRRLIGPRLSIFTPIVIDGQPWPRRLQSRESVTVYFDPIKVIEHGGRIRLAYARTACGAAGFGMSPATRQLRTMVTNNQRRAPA
jgi:hypothetical protein